MLNRSSIFAAAAVATVAVAALAPTSASAMRGRFGGMGGRSIGSFAGHSTSSFSTRSFASRAFVGRIGNPGIGHTFHVWPNRVGYSGINRLHIAGLTPFKKPIDIDCVTFKNSCDHDHHHHWWPWWVVKWHHPHVWIDGGYAVGGGDAYVGGAATTAAVQTTAPCNCLTKQYLQDGSVLFKDICTKEAAIATPDELKAQAQGESPTQTQ